jgi:hypothetical protein
MRLPHLEVDKDKPYNYSFRVLRGTKHLATVHVHTDTLTIGLDLHTEFSLIDTIWFIRAAKKFLKFLNYPWGVFVDDNNIKNNRFVKFLGFTLEKTIKGYNRYIWHK